MRIAMISAGAAGMYCGSCIHDNTLAAALQRQGHDAALIPLYTPMRTDEESVSIERVFYGAINVYLETRLPRLHRLLRPVASWLDRPGLLNRLSGMSSASSGRDLGALTLGVLQGEDGPSREELDKLVAWLQEDLKPDVVHLQQSMFAGLARRIKAELGVPVVCSLQGEDIFLDDLIEPYKTRIFEVLRERAADVDGFVTTGEFYAGYMAGYLGVPRERIHIVPMGISLAGFEGEAPQRAEGEQVIGFFARICPEKGLHHLLEAFRRLAERRGKETLRLRIAGYLGGRDRAYAEGLQRKVEEWGLAGRVDFVGEVDREGKLDFLRGLDVLSVPAVYREPKGLSILEAQAAGVPVVLPRHGIFPEILARTGGGVLVEPGSVDALAGGLGRVLDDPEEAAAMGKRARAAVARVFSDDTMATKTVALYQKILAGHPPAELPREAAAG